MSCAAKFSVTLQTEILSTETSDFLKQIIFLKSFNSVLVMYLNISDLAMSKVQVIFSSPFGSQCSGRVMLKTKIYPSWRYTETNI